MDDLNSDTHGRAGWLDDLRLVPGVGEYDILDDGETVGVFRKWVSHDLVGSLDSIGNVGSHGLSGLELDKPGDEALDLGPEDAGISLGPGLAGLGLAPGASLDSGSGHAGCGKLCDRDELGVARVDPDATVWDGLRLL